MHNELVMLKNRIERMADGPTKNALKHVYFKYVEWLSFLFKFRLRPHLSLSSTRNVFGIKCEKFETESTVEVNKETIAATISAEGVRPSTANHCTFRKQKQKEEQEEKRRLAQNGATPNAGNGFRVMRNVRKVRIELSIRTLVSNLTTE